MENTPMIINKNAKYPIPYPNQTWYPTPTNPYPLNYVHSPSPNHQLKVNYEDGTYLQGMSVNKGPQMFQINHPTNYGYRYQKPAHNNSIYKHYQLSGCSNCPFGKL